MYPIELGYAVDADRRRRHERAALHHRLRRTRRRGQADPKVAVLRSLPGPRLRRRVAARLATQLDDVFVESGTVLRKDGRHSRQAFVVVDGYATATREGRPDRDIGPGDVVGLPAEPTSAATVTARTAMRLLVAGPASVRVLVDLRPEPPPAGDDAERSKLAELVGRR